jgi:hypothetical protein
MQIEKKRAAKTGSTCATISSDISKTVQSTMTSSRRTRTALLAHFALMQSISTQQNWKFWEKKYLAMRVKQVRVLIVNIMMIVSLETSIVCLDL